jgi:hypothetical protein
MLQVKTRVKQAQHSDIMDLSDDIFESLLGSKGGGRGVSQMTRDLKRIKQGFFIVCEDGRQFPHIYKAAGEAGIKVAMRRGEKDGQEGVWVVRTA